MYDLIGDIHGHAATLHALLTKLGYALRGGAWRHPERTAIFLGDFVDRGPEIRATIDTVRRMVDAGSARAVIGNHEINALAYATPRLDAEGGFCRPHTERNRRLHEATLSQLSASERVEAIEWFRTLPLWLDLGGVRVVHACWDEPSIACVREVLAEEGGMTDDAVRRLHEEGTPEFDAMEMILKGPEIRLPAGVVLQDSEGHPRRVIRARWFESPKAWTYDEVVFPPSPMVPSVEVPQGERRDLPYYPASAPPLFFGHYWMSGESRPTLLAPNLACLDWSVARGGWLVAYRWEGEQHLDPARLHWVPVNTATHTMLP
ncbi:MAG: metallophosphoesterase [Phycisphaeraceae bacterium]|nr:metallophosphoesterase [Phycisphaeraceae bacterium]